jgi:hypothetical protein
MDLNDAVAILKRRGGSMHEQIAAGAYVHSYYTTEGKHLTRPVFTTDAVRKPVRDESYSASFRQRGEVSEMGSNPGSPTGPTIVMRLPGPITRYSIFEDNGAVVLVDHGTSNGVMQPGTGASVPTSDRRAINARVAVEQQRNRAWADNISAFWKGQRDAA